MIELSKIKCGFQARTAINQNVVDEYAAHLTAGGNFPPVILYYDKTNYWLADGYHRLYAHKHIGCLTIHEEVRAGSERDAKLYALGANGTHGLPRTNADKRYAVEIALDDDDIRTWSDRKIAELCAVTQPFVSSIRNPSKEDKKTEITGKKLTDSPIPLQPKGVITVIKKPLEAATGENTNATSATEATPSGEVSGNPHESYTELDALHDQIAELQDVVATGFMEATQDDKDAAKELISSLRKEIKVLSATLSSITTSRNMLQLENNEMKRQLTMQRKEIGKLRSPPNVKVRG